MRETNEVLPTMAIVRTTEMRTKRVLRMQQEKNLPKVLQPPPCTSMCQRNRIGGFPNDEWRKFMLTLPQLARFSFLHSRNQPVALGGTSTPR